MRVSKLQGVGILYNGKKINASTESILVLGRNLEVLKIGNRSKVKTQFCIRIPTYYLKGKPQQFANVYH